MFNLTGLRDAQIAGKTLFLGVSVRVFPDENSIWIGVLSEDGPRQSEWASSNPLRAWIEQKDRRRKNLLSAWAETYVFSCPGTSALLVSGLRTRTRTYTVGSPGSQAWSLNWYCQLSWVSMYRQQILGLLSFYNCMNQFFIINLFLCIHIYPTASVSLENLD